MTLDAVRGGDIHENDRAHLVDLAQSLASRRVKETGPSPEVSANRATAS
jgi:hypothetical protein